MPDRPAFAGLFFILYREGPVPSFCVRNDRVGATLAVALGVSRIERLDGSAQFRRIEGDRKGHPCVQNMKTVAGASGRRPCRGMNGVP